MLIMLRSVKKILGLGALFTFFMFGSFVNFHLSVNEIPDDRLSTYFCEGCIGIFEVVCYLISKITSRLATLPGVRLEHTVFIVIS